MVPLSKALYTEPAESLSKLSFKNNCEKIVDIGLKPSLEIFTAGFIVSFLISILSYILVEAPAIEARIVFKSKS